MFIITKTFTDDEGHLFTKVNPKQYSTPGEAYDAMREDYLTKLLNGGLMGERGSKPLRIAIEACELQIPKQPISKSWSPNLCPHCDADLGGDCNDGYYQNPHYERCPVCGQKLKYI